MISQAAPVTPPLLCDKPRPSVDVTQRGVQLVYLLSLVASGELNGDWTIQVNRQRILINELSAAISIAIAVPVT